MINSNKFVPRHILVKCLKAKDKEKILKAERERERSDTLPVQKKNTLKDIVSNHKQMQPEESDTIYFNCWKKRTVKPESYLQRKYHSRMKGKSRKSQMKENQENSSLADLF